LAVPAVDFSRLGALPTKVPIMFEKVLQLLSISCNHRNTSQPFASSVSNKQSSSGSTGWDAVTPAGKHYVVCLDCGKKFDYDWKEMRIVS
jgi:hypothetical protein